MRSGNARLRGKVTARSLFVDGDGRTPWARRYRDLVGLLCDEAGGLDTLTELKLSLCRRAAALMVECERMENALAEGRTVDVDLLARLSSHVRRISEVNYASAFAQEPFNKNGVTYKLSEKNKGQIYCEIIPLLNTPGRVELLDDKVLADQFVMLERRTGRGTNRDSIDHPPGAHDDRSNAVAGVLRIAAAEQIGSSSVWLRL